MAGVSALDIPYNFQILLECVRCVSLPITGPQSSGITVRKSKIGCKFTFPALNFLKYLVLWQVCQSWRYPTFFKFFLSVSGVSASRSQALRGQALQFERVNSVQDRVHVHSLSQGLTFWNIWNCGRCVSLGDTLHFSNCVSGVSASRSHALRYQALQLERGNSVQDRVQVIHFPRA